MTDEEMCIQVARQCDAVAHMAYVLAGVHRDFANMLRQYEMGSRGISEQVGKRTAAFMEGLGDMLNAMDAVSEEDHWLTPIFLEAQRIWPQLGDRVTP